jgi:hypothetical protein
VIVTYQTAEKNLRVWLWPVVRFLSSFSGIIEKGNQKCEAISCPGSEPDISGLKIRRVILL